MNRRVIAASFVTTLSLFQDPSGAACNPPTTGPDIAVAKLNGNGPARMTVNAIDGAMAYAIGTDALNVGSAPVPWVSGSRFHPVIAQNIYRWKQDAERPGGRFEHVGMSWLKHGFAAVPGSEFCSCEGSSGALGVGCNDPYTAGMNAGSNSTTSRRLGPRSEVDATTGFFVYPYTDIAHPQLDDQRLRVAESDLETTTDGSALRYIGEAQYVSPDDAQAGNALNNASYRELQLDATREFTWGGTLGAYPGVRGQEAVRAWKQIDSAVEISRVDYTDGSLPARFNLAAKAHDNGDGTWRYEYALHNLNSHRSSHRFVVQFPVGVTVTNAGSRQINHHSGEPYATTAWTAAVDAVAGTVTWSTDDFATNANANALRWGTLFNFWFDANEPPGTGTATVHLFRAGAAGEPDDRSVPTAAPGANCLFCDAFETSDSLRWGGGG